VDVVELTRALIRRPSVTPDDHGCQPLIAGRLEKLGFEIEALRFGEVDNLWARHGSTAPVLCFAGHTDVVPPGPREQWRVDPFAAEIHDGKLIARGAADMKAGLAAMVTAAERFVTDYPEHRGSLAFLITGDEEGAAQDGTLKVMQRLTQRDESIDWCVIGEPSSAEALGDTVRIGRRGSLTDGTNRQARQPDRTDDDSGRTGSRRLPVDRREPDAWFGTIHTSCNSGAVGPGPRAVSSDHVPDGKRA